MSEIKKIEELEGRVEYLVDALLSETSKNAKLLRAITAVSILISESGGVYGLHLNGEVAPWDELLAGGRLEEWLLSFSEAEKLI